MQTISYTYPPKGNILSKFLRRFHIKHLELENFNEEDINSFHKADNNLLHTEVIYYLNPEDHTIDFIHVYEIHPMSKIKEFIIKPISKHKINI